jgi:hypothetical protein
MIINTMVAFGSLVTTPFPTIKATNSLTILLTTSLLIRVGHIRLKVWIASTFICLATNTQSYLQ